MYNNEANIAPENGWLEYFLRLPIGSFRPIYFQGRLMAVSFRENVQPENLQKLILETIQDSTRKFSEVTATETKLKMWMWLDVLDV